MLFCAFYNDWCYTICCIRMHSTEPLNPVESLAERFASEPPPSGEQAANVKTVQPILNIFIYGYFLNVLKIILKLCLFILAYVGIYANFDVSDWPIKSFT